MLAKKYQIHVLLAVTALVIIFYPSISRKPDQQRVEASTIAATHFLELLDTEKYDQSWDACASYLKNDISKEEWIKRLSAVRSVSGKLLERKQESYTYTKDSEEAKANIPQGEYMVYYFDSQFQNKDHLTETLTIMLEKDNNWRVAGYFIE